MRLAEQAHGPVRRPVDFAYVWGDALDELARRQPDVRIVNLETAITRSDDSWKDKGVTYRMHPDRPRQQPRARRRAKRGGGPEPCRGPGARHPRRAGPGESARLRVRQRNERDPAGLGRGGRSARREPAGGPVARDPRARRRDGPERQATRRRRRRLHPLGGELGIRRSRGARRVRARPRPDRRGYRPRSLVPPRPSHRGVRRQAHPLRMR